jgi:hypothetical protein
MRMIYLVTAVTLAAASAPAWAATDVCSVPGQASSLALLKSGGTQNEAICTADRVASGAPGIPGIKLAQGPGSPCMAVGQAICFNHWVSVCQCASFGCTYRKTSRRC